MHARFAAAAVLVAALAVQPATTAPSRPSVVIRPVASVSATASGQNIILPQKDVHVVVTTYDIPRGADLPEHKHPFARYAYVFSGTLRVSNTETNRSDTYKTGDFIVEAIDQWHKASNIGRDTVKLLVIDQIEGDQSNTILRH